MTCLPYNRFGYARAMVPYVGWSVKARRLCTVYTSPNVSPEMTHSSLFFKHIYSLQWKEVLSAIEHSRSFLAVTTKDNSHTLSVNRQVKASLHKERHSKDIEEDLFTGNMQQSSPLKGKCWELHGALGSIHCRSLQQKARAGVSV